MTKTNKLRSSVIVIIGAAVLLSSFAWGELSVHKLETKKESWLGLAHAGQGGTYNHLQRKRGKRTGIVRRMVRKLRLSEKQTIQIKGLLIEARKKRIALRSQARITRIELRQLVLKEDVSDTHVEVKLKKLVGLRGDILRTRIDVVLKIKEILTNDQRKKAGRLLKRLLKSRRKR